MQTRKYPRTLQEAFGPHTSNEIYDQDDRAGYGRAWWLAMLVISSISIGLIFF